MPGLLAAYAWIVQWGPELKTKTTFYCPSKAVFWAAAKELRDTEDPDSLLQEEELGLQWNWRRLVNQRMIHLLFHIQ